MNLYLPCLLLLLCSLNGFSQKADKKLQQAVLNYIFNELRTAHTLLFTCQFNDTINFIKYVSPFHPFLEIIYPNSRYDLDTLLTHRTHGNTSILVDCKCSSAKELLIKASADSFFNTTYNWILWDEHGACLAYLTSPEIKYFGPNAQLLQVVANESVYQISDCHSKGRHLGAPLEIVPIATVYHGDNGATHIGLINDVQQMRSIYDRGNFNGLVLRGATVIDRNNISDKHQIEKLLSGIKKEDGITSFSKYHFALLEIIRDRLNFSLTYRNARGWAGRLGNTSFRLGYIGIMSRKEVDIGASASYNRLNRYSELDIIHQGWKFESAFLYRLTPNLLVRNSKGNFLAPFEMYVWIVTTVVAVVITAMWIRIEWSLSRLNIGTFIIIPVNVVGVFCQQGLETSPRAVSTRVIALTTFLFSLILYNFYTSSVVGGLLSNTNQGPSTVEELITSKLQVSFEDIGYYKVLFHDRKVPIANKLLETKILPKIDRNGLPLYTQLKNALPYMRRGEFAFHCELVDAYPEIAKQFDVTEICDLRVVHGLIETELINSVVHKNSIYTELLRIIMVRMKESGLIKRLLIERQPKKPECQNLYTVYPVTFNGMANAMVLLAIGIALSAICGCVEVLSAKFWKI
uniref:Ionotropic glutamate receptor C-terminal domain-containing protein n=1 Tax=Stomoxys calcitrans TaxID=35570 RepID=A0A1I8PA50_STOCA